MTQQAQWQMADDAASLYENEFVPALFEPWAELIVNQANLKSGQSVLDVACGTGVGARAIAKRVGTEGNVTGLDFTPGMLEVAREKSPDITWVEGSACELPFEDNSFDTIINLFGLMFFPDKPLALKETMRVLKPGGSMHIAVWHDPEHCNGYGEFIDLLRRIAGNETADWMMTPFSMGDIDALYSLCTEAGITNPSIQTLEGHAVFPSIERWITTQVRGTPIAAMLDDETCATILNEVQKEFTHFLTPEGTVQFDMQAHLITAKMA